MIEINFQNNFFKINEKDFQSLNSKGFGLKQDKIYYLNIYETLFLLEKNKIKVIEKNNEISFDYIFKKLKIDFKFYLVYKDLKSKGYIVLSGSKYGFAFRIYDKGIKIGDDHSLWLVEPVIESEKVLFKDILGKNRIAHGSNKKLIFAIVDIENSITYIENSWKRL